MIKFAFGYVVWIAKTIYEFPIFKLKVIFYLINVSCIYGF